MTGMETATSQARLVAEQVAAVLRNRPSAVFTDIDGTISAIAPTPDESFVEPLARASLSRLAEVADVVAVITGRAGDKAERLVDLPGLIYIGNHGLERREGGVVTDHPQGLLATQRLTETLDQVRSDLEAGGLFDGVMFEHKRLTATVHYRNAPNINRLLPVLRASVSRAADAHDLQATAGRLIFELRPRVAVTKGTAVRDLIDEHDIAGAVFFGDDTTDVDAFRIMRNLRDQGRLNAIRVGVVGPETPPEVLEESDLMLPDVHAVANVLALLAESLDAER